MVGKANEETVAAGIQIGNTVTSTYIVDNYPLQSMSVITFYAVFLNLSAFINPVSQAKKLSRLQLLADHDMRLVFHCSLANFSRLDLDLHRARLNRSVRRSRTFWISTQIRRVYEE